MRPRQTGCRCLHKYTRQAVSCEIRHCADWRLYDSGATLTAYSNYTSTKKNGNKHTVRNRMRTTPERKCATLPKDHRVDM